MTGAADKAGEGLLGRERIPTVADVYVGEIAQVGRWVVANVETRAAWPTTLQKATFAGERIWIVPLTTDAYPALVMQLADGRSREDCERLLMRFLSSLAWVHEAGYMVDTFSGGSNARPIGRRRPTLWMLRSEFDLDYIPEPTDDRAQRALALMREGRALNHPGYAFLSFFRVLESALPNGTARGRWIDSRIDVIRSPRARDAIRRLRSGAVADIGSYLLHMRQAIAHGSRLPVLHPDDAEEYRSLHGSVPIMDALAELAVEEHLGVETAGTIYRKHLYELAGWKALFGAESVRRIIEGGDQELELNLPAVRVEVRGKEPYQSLADLGPVDVHWTDGKLDLTYLSADAAIKLRLVLDFADERMHCDPLSSIVCSSEDAVAAAEAALDANRFVADVFGNGSVAVYDTSSGELLGRTAPYMPMNMRFDPVGAAVGRARLVRRLEHARDRDQRYAVELERWQIRYDVRGE